MANEKRRLRSSDEPRSTDESGVGGNTLSANDSFPSSGNTTGSGIDPNGHGSTGSGNTGDSGSESGRTRTGAKNSKADKNRESETLEVEAQEVKSKRRGKKAKNPSKSDSESAAKGLIEMIELFATARFGSMAAFTVEERFFIEPSLCRLIERYGGIGEQFSAFVDPVLLLLGVGLYANRVGQIAAAQSEKKQSSSKPSSDSRSDQGSSVEPDLASLFGIVGQ